MNANEQKAATALEQTGDVVIKMTAEPRPRRELRLAPVCEKNIYRPKSSIPEELKKRLSFFA
jgi:hypothetical protein